MALALRTVDLVKEYPAKRGPGVRALRGVSVSLETGQTLGIVGESGCGKSTLARLIVGLEGPTSGSIEVFGEAVLPGHHRELARRVQLVFQDPYSSSGPALEGGGCDRRGAGRTRPRRTGTRARLPRRRAARNGGARESIRRLLSP